MTNYLASYSGTTRALARGERVGEGDDVELRMGRGHAADNRGYVGGSRFQKRQDSANPLRAGAKLHSRKAG